jgi:hypothetical protein
MVGWNVNDIRIWSDLLQHLERLDTMSLQWLDESKWKPFGSNMDHGIIPYVRLSVTPT